MRPHLLPILLFIFANPHLSAQHHSCGYDLIVEQLDKKYPGYKESVQKTFEDAKLHASLSNRSNTTYNIPVVVHVVWNEEEERIPDSLITSQIEVLNEDFQRQNVDADNIREIFRDVVGNPMIEFTLQEIVYIETESLFEVNLFTGVLPDNVKDSANGGSDARDISRNLNIWICKIQPMTIAGQNLGQILGYAYPPNDLDNWPDGFQAPAPNYEGVVLDYRVVGKNSPFLIDPGLGFELQFSKGRTAVHEVGHYLGLRHTWADGDGVSPNSCNFDDGIEDTPNTGSQASLLNCDITRNTCQSNADDLPDMVENYMDTANENCQNSFTLGQIALMRSVLENQRCQLIQAADKCSVSTEQLANVEIEISPNPSNGIFQIYSTLVDLNDFEIELIDISGNPYPIQIKSNTIDLSDFSAGIYFFRGINKSQIFQQRLIKL